MNIQQLKEAVDRALAKGLHPSTPVEIRGTYGDEAVLFAREEIHAGSRFLLEPNREEAP